MNACVKNRVSIIVWIAAFVQFANALEYMIIAPIGPYLVEALHLKPNQIGLLTGSYTLFSVASGVIGYRILDRWNKKSALLSSLMVLFISTISCTVCHSLYTILIARSCAGFFGGFTLSLVMALLMNNVSETQRGKSFAVVMGVFPIVSVVGIPFSVWIAHLLGWRVPFIVIGALNVFGMIGVFLGMPSLELHVDKSLSQPIRLNGKTILAASLLGVALFPIYLLIPSLAILLQFNMSVMAAHLPLVFMLGGIASLGGAQLAGRLADKVGYLPVVIMSTIVLILSLMEGLILYNIMPTIFVSLMLFAVYMRVVATTALSSHFPEPHQRSGFSALQLAITNTSATLAAFLSTIILVEKADASLGNVFWLAILSIITAVALPVGGYLVNKFVQGRQQQLVELVIDNTY